MPLASSGSESSSSSSATLSAESVELVFRTFARRWVHKWEKVNADQKARALWLRDLRALGVNDENVRLGLHRSASLEWPPSPAEFAALCKPTPADLGIPDLEAAWREALDIACGRKSREACSHAVVWHALGHAGDIGRMPEEKGRKAFDYAYGKAVDMAMAGESLREIPKALPKPEDATVTPEQRRKWAAEGIAKLNAITGRSSP